MPVYKFKSFEEAEKALWYSHPKPDYYKKVAELWEFANELKPYRCEQGVFKFKNIKEANIHRENFERQKYCR